MAQPPTQEEMLYPITPKLLRQIVRIHRLRPVKGGRKHLSSALENSLKEALRGHCATIKCSMSLFVNTVVADAINFNLDRQDRYDLIPEHVLKIKHTGRGATPAAAARKRKRLIKGSDNASGQNLHP
jgi:hypothetical protein